MSVGWLSSVELALDREAMDGYDIRKKQKKEQATLDIQTPPEKVFGPPKTYPKHLLRRYLDVQGNMKSPSTNMSEPTTNSTEMVQRLLTLSNFRENLGQL